MVGIRLYRGPVSEGLKSPSNPGVVRWTRLDSRYRGGEGLSEWGLAEFLAGLAEFLAGWVGKSWELPGEMSGMRTQEVEGRDISCPWCNAQLDRMTSLDKADFKAGDLSVCMRCLGFLEIQDGPVLYRKLEETEFQSLSTAEQQDLLWARRIAEKAGTRLPN